MYTAIIKDYTTSNSHSNVLIKGMGSAKTQEGAIKSATNDALKRFPQSASINTTLQVFKNGKIIK